MNYQIVHVQKVIPILMVTVSHVFTNVKNVVKPLLNVNHVLISESTPQNVSVHQVTMMMDITPNVKNVLQDVKLVDPEKSVTIVKITDSTNHTFAHVHPDNTIVPQKEPVVLVTTDVENVPTNPTLVILVLKTEPTIHQPVHVHTELPKSLKSVPPVMKKDVKPVLELSLTVLSVNLTENHLHQNVHV
jgi:hypothetical protein